MSYFGALVQAGSGVFRLPAHLAVRLGYLVRAHREPWRRPLTAPSTSCWTHCDYDFHEDPYPTTRLLREHQLYRNDDLNFWALTRHADVRRGFRNGVELSNKLGVSLDPISRARAYRTMSFLAMDDPAICGCALWCQGLHRAVSANWRPVLGLTRSTSAPL